MPDWNSKFWRGEVEHDGPMWDDLSREEQDRFLKDHDMVRCTDCGDPVFHIDGLPDVCEKCFAEEVEK